MPASVAVREEYEFAKDADTSVDGAESLLQGNKGPCGTSGCHAPDIRTEMRLQRQIEDKHYSTLIQIVIGCTVATCSLMLTLAAAIIKFN